MTHRATRALILLVAIAGCTGKRAGAPAPSAASAPPSGAAQVDALAEAEAELAANAAELNALGVKIAWGRHRDDQDQPGRAMEPDTEPEVPTPETPMVEPTRPSRIEPSKKAEHDKPSPKPTTKNTNADPPAGEPTGSGESSCQKICTLAGVACDLSKRICQLADDHEGDARYEDACWNAERQCEDASDACSDCTAC